MDDVTFTWEIKEFDMCPQSSGDYLNSSTFSIDCLKTTTFSLLLYPRGKEDDGGEYVSIYIQRHKDNGKDEIHLKLELCLVDASGNCKREGKSRYRFQKETTVGIRNFCQRHYLLHSGRSIFLQENKLTVKCLITVLDRDKGDAVNMHGPKDYEDLSRGFGELFKSGIHSDMTIAVSGEEFKVHRAILENRCPKLVEQLVKVGDSKAYTLPSIEAPLLLTILNYVYTGVCCDNGMLEKICMAANTYSLPGLRSSLLPYIECITATTQIKVLQTVFKWEIRDSTSLQFNKEIRLPLISDKMPSWGWMRISLSNITQNDADRSCVLSFQRVHGDEIAFVHCELKIYDGRGGLYAFKICEHTFENELKWEWPIDFEANSTDAIIRLHVKIRVSSNRHYTETKEVMYNTIFQKKPPCIQWSTLQRDLQNVYENMTHSDVILRLGTEELRAHKAVLCSRSEVFSKMFLHETLENQTDTVDIKDVDVETMASILKYMYCGVVDGPMDVNKAIPIYAASDKYQLLVLREKCGVYLKSNMNAENVSEILILADEHNDGSLKKCTFDFILYNPEEILNSEKGLKVLEEKKHLYVEIVDLLLRNASKHPVVIH